MVRIPTPRIPTPTLRVPKGIGRFFSWMVPRSFAGRIATVSALLLLTSVIIVWGARIWGRANVPVGHAISTGRMVFEFSLALIVPFVAYWMIRWWRVVDISPFPDIDSAWNAGVAALASQGLEMDSLPLFLILGTPHSKFERQLMENSLPELRVRGVPHSEEVNNSLHWYVTADAIYLCCTFTSALSAVARQWAKNESTLNVSRAQWVEPKEWSSSLYSSASDSIDPASKETLPPTGGTIAAGAVNLHYEESIGPGTTVEQPKSNPTEISFESSEMQEGSVAVAVPVRSIRSKPMTRTRRSSVGMSFPQLSESEQNRQLERLQYVCRLLNRARGPHCGANGALALLPYELAVASQNELVGLAESARRDLEVAQETLRVHLPVSALVAGLEHEAGFSELANRLPTNYLDRRLGGRFTFAQQPTAENLNNHSDRLCDAFEEWIHRLFREKDALQKQRGNRSLCALLCRIRHHLKPNLRQVLGDIFGSVKGSETPNRQTPRVRFSGCYFSSIGQEQGSSAFVRGVLEDKLVAEQDAVSWFESARRTHFMHQVFIWTGWVVFATALTSLAYQITSTS